MKRLICIVCAYISLIGVSSAEMHKSMRLPRVFEYELAADGGGSVPSVPDVEIDLTRALKPAEYPFDIRPVYSTDPNISSFVGIWHGHWEGTLDTYLTIVEYEENKVKAFYSWGADLIVSDPGMGFIWGVIQNDVLLLPREKTSITLQLQSDGAILGLKYAPGINRPYRALFTRVDLNIIH